MFKKKVYETWVTSNVGRIKIKTPEGYLQPASSRDYKRLSDTTSPLVGATENFC